MHTRCEQIKNENKPLKIQKNKTILFEHKKHSHATCWIHPISILSRHIFSMKPKRRKRFDTNNEITVDCTFIIHSIENVQRSYSASTIQKENIRKFIQKERLLTNQFILAIATNKNQLCHMKIYKQTKQIENCPKIRATSF